MNEDDKNALIQNSLYVIQDIEAIKTKDAKIGSMIKFRIRNEKQHYEVSVGTVSIKINKYKPE